MVDLLLDRVSKRFGDVWAVRELSLRVDDGEAIVLIGPTGSGKTTVLRLIAGLETPTQGDVLFAGRPGASDPDKRDVAMLFASNRLYPKMTARSNISFPLTVRSVPEPERTHRVNAEAGALGIARFLERMPDTLSAGQASLVHLAKAMVRAPGLFLIDEPLNAVDARARRELRRHLRMIQQGYGVTAVYATHDQEDAMILGDRVVVIKEGAVEQSGPPADLYQRPDNVFVAQFMGSPQMSIMRATAGAHGVDLGGLTLDAPRDLPDDVLVGVRPERWAIDPEGLQAKVIGIEDRGTDLHVELRFARDEFTVRWPEKTPTIGDVVRVRPVAFHLFHPDTRMSLHHS